MTIFAALVLAATFPTITQVHTGAPSLNPSPSVTNFTFVVAGDDRPAKPDDPLTQPLQDIITALKQRPPVLVVWNGDTISGKVAAAAPAQYSAFLNAFDGLDAPLFNASGNHELVHDIKCGTNSGEFPYQDVLAAYTSSMAAPYGMFRYANAAFLIVNTDELGVPLIPAAHCSYNGWVSPTQLKALKATLKALESDTTVTHTFLFMHRPIHDRGNSHQIGNGKSDKTPYGKQIEAFRHAIDHGGYKKLLFVFASHDHLFDIYPANAKLSGTSPGSGGEPTFIITGGAGAPLAKCSNGGIGKPGAYYHYISVTVAGANVTVAPVPLYGSMPCTPPPAATLTPATGAGSR